MSDHRIKARRNRAKRRNQSKWQQDAERVRLFKNPPRECIIYFIHAPEVDRIKIGITIKSVETRLRGLIGQSPCELKVLGWMCGSVKAERALHRQFAAYRHHDEWFSASQEIYDYISLNCVID